MIHEVDSALRGLILREGLDGAEAEVMFDAPTKDWAGRRNSPTVDVYLYDIREDLRRRERGMINEYDGSGRVVARRLPPRHFKLSYLITAWTQRPVDEHRLLSSMLQCFLRHEIVPADLLEGPLAELALPVPISVALPPPEDRSFADVWSALGGELKPSLDIVVSVPTDSGQRGEVGPPVMQPPQVSLGGTSGWPPREPRAGRPPAVVPEPGPDGGRSSSSRRAGGTTSSAGAEAAEAGHTTARARPEGADARPPRARRRSGPSHG